MAVRITVNGVEIPNVESGVIVRVDCSGGGEIGPVDVAVAGGALTVRGSADPNRLGDAAFTLRPASGNPAEPWLILTGGQGLTLTGGRVEGGTVGIAVA